MFWNTLKKSLLSTLIILTFFMGGFAAMPQKAEAALGFGDIVFDPTNFVENTITAVKTAYLAFKEAVLDPIGWHLSTMIIQAITAAIVDWINSGFQGSPAFVQNLQEEFTRVANLEFEKFLRSNDLEFMCYPQSIRLSLLLGYRGNQFRKQAQCTITGVVSNLQGFMSGNWSQGGLAGFLSLSRAENNPYTATVMAETELARRIAAKVGIEDKKLQAGRLFKSFEVCETLDVRDDCPDGGEACPARQENVCRIGTPGDVIATQLNKALALGEDKLVIAQSFDQIVSALLAQLARMALTGSGGLYGLSNGSYNGGTPYTNQLATGSSSSGGAQGNLLGAIETSIRDEGEYRDQKAATLNLYGAPMGMEGKALDIIACYNGKINSRTASLSSNDIQTARTRITAASSTLTNIILPKKVPFATRVASSTEIISAFSVLKNKITSTTSVQAYSGYASEYSSLVSSAHTRSDLVEAEREFTTESENLYDATNSRPGDPLNGLSIKLEDQLAQCRAFPQGESGGGGPN